MVEVDEAVVLACKKATARSGTTLAVVQDAP
jgi:hypothetical protein